MRPNHTPHLYVGVGEGYHFFTLRETYLREIFIGGQPEYLVSSYHVCNLSQDPGEAWQKAQDHAARLGLALSNTRPTESLNEIRRRSAEQVEADRIAEERRREEAQRERDEAARADIAAGVFPFGKYAGRSFREVDNGYLCWLLDFEERGEFEGLMSEIAKAILEQLGDVRPPPPADIWIGSVGERREFEAEVEWQRGFRNDFGVVFITKLRDLASGAQLVVKSGRFYPDVGARIRFKATIKDHDEYQGVKQTVLQRVAAITELQAA